MKNNTFVSEIVATRLSHDLIGNIGAVANAVELINDADSTEDENKDIINILNFSSAVLSNRLKFFRLCFGLSNASVKTVDELEKISKDYLSSLGNPNYYIDLDLSISTPKIYKLVMPTLMMLADVIIKNGKISVIQTDTALKISVVSDTALNQTKLETIPKVLNGETVEENPSSYAPLYYLMAYLDGSGVALKFENNTFVIGD